MHSQPRSRIPTPRCRGLNGQTLGVLAVQPVSFRGEIDVHPEDVHRELQFDLQGHPRHPGRLPDTAGRLDGRQGEALRTRGPATEGWKNQIQNVGYVALYPFMPVEATLWT